MLTVSLVTESSWPVQPCFPIIFFFQKITVPPPTPTPLDPYCSRVQWFSRILLTCSPSIIFAFIFFFSIYVCWFWVSGFRILSSAWLDQLHDIVLHSFSPKISTFSQEFNARRYKHFSQCTRRNTLRSKQNESESETIFSPDYQPLIGTN